MQSLVKFLDRSGAVSDAVCSLARVGCAMHTTYADCNHGVCRLQTASAAGLLQSCKSIQLEPQVCRSQQLLLGLVTNAGVNPRWCPQLGAVFECLTAQNVEITGSMTGLLKSQIL